MNAAVERTIRTADAGYVRRVFGSVARRYDVMNDLMSLGAHRLWKDQMVAALAPRRGGHYLDVAGGTGDVAARIVRAGGDVMLCDINAEMIATGRRRRRAGTIAWVQGDATGLPFAASSFDGYTIAFGLRNVADIEAALAEARRVLKPGGRFLCLEFSRVVVPMLREAYDAYSSAVIPRLGAAVGGDRDAYLYLIESIRRFPAQEQLAALVTQAGLERVAVQNMAGGIVAMHAAWRL